MITFSDTKQRICVSKLALSDTLDLIDRDAALLYQTFRAISLLLVLVWTAGIEEAANLVSSLLVRS